MKPEEIKAIRKKLGLTQLEFGKLVGASERAVQYWEKGTKAPLKTFLNKIRQLNSEF